MISDDLKRLYASNDLYIEAIETIEIYHSKAGRVFLTSDAENHSFKIDDGSIQDFISYGFKITLPESGSNQQDMSITFDNVAGIAVSYLDKASSDYSEPITLRYRMYIKGNVEMQSTTLSLSLTDISATYKTVSARATRSDLINREFPFGNGITYDARFGGLK